MKVSRRVALVTLDGVGARLAGSAIRALELARVLGEAGHEPTVFTPSLGPDADTYPFPVRAFHLKAARRTLLPILAAAEAIVLPLDALVRIPALAGIRVPLVFDIYDPFIFELLASGSLSLDERRREVRAHCSIIKHVLRRGDFFICASERQRDMWLGALVSTGRVVPSVHADHQFRNLIDVVPFGIGGGLGEAPPLRKRGQRPVLNGALSSIAPDDTLIVSGGAMWDWQDPLTAIHAIARLAERRSDIHLILFAGEHPTSGKAPALADHARIVAAQLGVLDRQVHFVSEWIPYAARGRYLGDCDAGITTHRSSLESHFSFRTRVLDYLWAGLPVICTEGDVLADLIARRQLGAVVPEGDDGALASVFERIADDAEFVAVCRRHIAEIRPSLTWRVAAEPLVHFCETPRLGDRNLSGAHAARDPAVSAWRVLRTEGLREAALRIHRHVFLRT